MIANLLLGAIFSLFGLIFANFQSAQSKAIDTERKTDINAVYVKLEEHYNEHGDYPTEKELTKESEDQLPGLDPEALVDPNGKFIQSGDYKYEPIDCTAIGCAHYTLSAQLESGEMLTKQSLN